MSIWWDVNEYDHWLAVTSRQMQPGLLRLIYIINNVNIHFRWRCFGSVKCLCLLFCCRNAFVLGVGGRWMLVGVWSVTWPLRIISFILLGGTRVVQKLYVYNQSFPLHKASKTKKNWSPLFISKQECHFTLRLPQRSPRGGQDYALDRSLVHHRTHTLEFPAEFSHWISARDITFVMLRGVSDAELHICAVTLTPAVNLLWHSLGAKDGLGITRGLQVTIKCPAFVPPPP